MLRDVRSAELLLQKPINPNSNEDHERMEMEGEIDELEDDYDVEDECDVEDEGFEKESDDCLEMNEDDEIVDIDSESQSGSSHNSCSSSVGKWYLTRNVNGKKQKIHLRQALKFMIPREYVSRERARRHIATNYLPGREKIDSAHNILVFRFVLARMSGQILVCKVASMSEKGKYVKSASNENDNVTCILIPLVEKSLFVYEFPKRVIVSKPLKVTNVICEIGLRKGDGESFKVLQEFREHIASAKNELLKSKDSALAKTISKSLPIVGFQEVQDILKKKNCTIFKNISSW